MRLSIIRLTIFGLPNVYVFFVISGYALSHKPLTLIRLKRLEDTYNTLASSAFHQHTRLFLLAAVVCFFSMFITYFRFWEDRDGISGAATATLETPHFKTTWDQLWDYVRFMFDLSGPFHVGSKWSFYDEPLWTSPVDFMSSFVVFGSMLALASSTVRTRTIIVSYVAAFCLYIIYLPGFIFCGGMLVAALRLHLDKEHKTTDNQSNTLHIVNLKPRTIYMIRSGWERPSRCLRLATS